MRVLGVGRKRESVMGKQRICRWFKTSGEIDEVKGIRRHRKERREQGKAGMQDTTERRN